ncbi:MAG: alpha/beta hydrolase [Chitinispirillaceae bacterium]|nr:alpha/beta hydrolase [Chitinispirillaceae bacterium]
MVNQKSITSKFNHTTTPFLYDKVIKLNYEGFNYYVRIVDRCNESTENNPPLIFISGAFQSVNSLTKYIEAFSPEYRMMMLDLPGTGNSDVLPSNYGIDFLTDSLNDLFLTFGIKRAEVVAISYASPIAYNFAKKFPYKISHLLLCGIMKEFSPLLQKKTAKALELMLENKIEEFVIHAIENCLTFSKEPEKINNYKFVRRFLYSGLKNLNEIQKIKFIENTKRLLEHKPLDLSPLRGVKVLVETGEYDTYTTPKYCEEVASTIENATFITLKNADHLFHMEQFEASVEILRNFLKDLPIDHPAISYKKQFGREHVVDAIIY